MSQYRKNYQAIWQRGYRLRNRKRPVLRVAGGRAHMKRCEIPDARYSVSFLPEGILLRRVGDA